MLRVLKKLRPAKPPQSASHDEEKYGFVTIVAGLPRSGTSMMMRMLESGGMPVLIDGIREADTDNPKGYYEFEAVKRTKEDAAWLDGAAGKAVKMVYRLLYDLPGDRSYRVVLMRRKMEEILASQRKMLQRSGEPGDGPTDDEMASLFTSEIAKFQDWVKRQNHIEILEISYNELMEDAAGPVRAINRFLDGRLDVESMQQVVDQGLYRNRVD